MARKASYHHPLQEIRAAVAAVKGSKAGTQDGFARLLSQEKAGVTIKKVESGKLPLSKGLATLITAATGADTSSMLNDCSGSPVALDGTPYDEHAFRVWRSGPRVSDVDPLIEVLCGHVQQTLRHAFEEVGLEGFRSAFCDLSAAIGDQGRHWSNNQLPFTAENVYPGMGALWDSCKVAVSTDGAGSVIENRRDTMEGVFKAVTATASKRSMATSKNRRLKRTLA
jgi:hypothetical protein